MRAIAEIERAEDLFDLLGEVYQDSILRVHRFRILKRFGREVARLEEAAPLLAEEARRACYAAALRRIHDEYVRGDVPEALALHKPPELVTLRRPAR
jgi:hypothetical protein